MRYYDYRIDKVIALAQKKIINFAKFRTNNFRDLYDTIVLISSGVSCIELFLLSAVRWHSNLIVYVYYGSIDIQICSIYMKRVNKFLKNKIKLLNTT